MRASAMLRTAADARMQSQRATRETPSTSIVFHPVSSQTSHEATTHRSTYDVALVLSDLSFALSASVGDWVVCLTRSVGADLTSAVLSRCSQSSIPRASSRLTYSMNSF